MIIKTGDERLTKRCTPITNPDEVKELVEEMKNVINNTETAGLGLAAPQLGHNIQVFVMRTGCDSSVTPKMLKSIEVVINPEILRTSEKMIWYNEGCLSVPDKTGLVKRHKEIKVRYVDGEGRTVTRKYRGTDSVLFQHEYDHLQGKTIIETAIRLVDKPKQKEAEPVVTQEAADENTDI